MVKKSDFTSSGPRLFLEREYEFVFEFVNLLLKIRIKGEGAQAGQALQGTNLQKKEAQKDQSIHDISLEKTYS